LSNLTNLPNIGHTLAQKLEKIGVTSQAELAELGSIEAVVKIEEKDSSACYNMLYALEGAIRGIRWHGIPKEERTHLKAEFDARAAALGE
jgi:DNA transformation protein